MKTILNYKVFLKNNNYKQWWLWVTYSREMFGAVDDFIEAAVNDVATIVQHRIKHNLWLFNTNRNQHHRPLDVLEVIKLGRVIAEIITSLHTHTGGHQTGSGYRWSHYLPTHTYTHTHWRSPNWVRSLLKSLPPYTHTYTHWRSSNWVGSSLKSLLPCIQKETYLSRLAHVGNVPGHRSIWFICQTVYCRRLGFPSCSLTIWKICWTIWRTISVNLLSATENLSVLELLS